MATNYTPLTSANNLDPTDLNSRLQELDDAIEALKTGLGVFTVLGINAFGAETVSSGEITSGRFFIQITSESGNSDDVTFIDPDGQTRYFTLVQAANGHTITLKHGSSNLEFRGDADIVLQSLEMVMLFYDGLIWRDV